MSAPRSPWTDRLLEILSDGRWHTYEELAELAGPLVPPGQAARRTEADRASQSRSRNGTARPRHGAFDQADPIATGRRRIIRDSLTALARSQSVEFDGPRHARRVRLVTPKARKR